jgi:predicted nucleotidyltransferase
MSGTNAVEALLDLIDAVVYGDAFDCAVTFDELWRYSLVPIGREELRRRMTDPPICEIVAERDGFYALRGREDLVDRRVGRRERARLLRRRGRLVARCLQHFPFVRGILLTGSVAADDADRDGDVDMLVIVQRRRLALAFAVLAPLSRLVSSDVFCPNYYLSETHLSMTRRDHYVARELMQAEPLAGSAEQLFSANTWVDALLPNATPRGDKAAPIPFGRVLQWLLELPFRGAVGDRLDRRAHGLALRRLTVHHARFGSPFPEKVKQRFEADVELRFHGRMLIERATERYTERRAELGRLLSVALAGSSGSTTSSVR